MLHRVRAGKRWKEGPGTVVMTSGTSAWLMIRTKLLKVAVANLTPATNEEKLGVEVMEKYLPALREELGQRMRRRMYWDITSEGGLLPTPVDPEEDASTVVPPTAPESVDTARGTPRAGPDEGLEAKRPRSSGLSTPASSAPWDWRI